MGRERKLPESVLRAKADGDTEALRRLGRLGAKARATARARVAQAARIQAQEFFEIREQTGENIIPVD